MAYDRFLIAPIEVGLETDVKPWLLPDSAFSELENAYIYRGRVRKRFGTLDTGVGPGIGFDPFVNSRVGLDLSLADPVNGVTDAFGNANGFAPGGKFKVGQFFNILPNLYTVVALGAPAAMISSRTGATATFNTTTGAYSFTGAEPNTAIFFFPCEPIMGLTIYEQNAIINHDAYAFDTQFVYKYINIGTAWTWITSDLTRRWHGDNSQFFWATNWQGINAAEIRLFVTNYNATYNAAPGANDDPIYTFDGTTWAAFRPKFVPTGIGNLVQTARIVLPFKERLLLLNTIESNAANSYNSHFAQRCRFSHNGLPFPEFPTNLGPTVAGVLAGNVGVPSYGLPWKTGVIFTIDGVTYTVVSAVAGVQPMATTGPVGGGIVYTFDIATGAFNFTGAPAGDVLFFPAGGGAWIENNYPGWDGAGWIDATTDEEIIGAEFIKDRLIVYFENSTWELAYTGNQVQPFIWQKLNTELGAISTFSLVPFDKMVLGIGLTGVHACNGSNVERIDNKIPMKIYDLRKENDGVKRVHGIRDYKTEVVYWTFPDTSCVDGANTYPNKVMLYNYANDTWAFNDQSYTCFGYFEQSIDRTWENTGETWESTDWTWTSGLHQANERGIIAGNQQGTIVQISPDSSTSVASLYLTGAIEVAGVLRLTIIDHTLRTGDFCIIKNASATIGGVIFSAYEINDKPFQVSVVDKDTVTTTDISLSAVVIYAGVGKVTVLPRIDIYTKQLNPYNKQGKNVYLAKIDFCVESTDSGKITVDYAPSSSNISIVADAATNNCNLGTNVLETSPYPTVPLETTQDQLWHPVYFQTEGAGIQLHLYLSEDQMYDIDAVNSDFQLEGMVLYTQSVGRLA